MDDRALRVLEFTKIRALLAEQCVSPLGRELATGLIPTADYERVCEMRDETEEAVVCLTALPNHPLVPFEDVRQAVAMAAVGSTLSPRSLLDVASNMRAARSARSALVTEKENTPRVTEIA